MRCSLVIVVHVLFIVIGIGDDGSHGRIHGLLVADLPQKVHCNTQEGKAREEEERAWEEGRDGRAERIIWGAWQNATMQLRQIAVCAHLVPRRCCWFRLTHTRRIRLHTYTTHTRKHAQTESNFMHAFTYKIHGLCLYA